MFLNYNICSKNKKWYTYFIFIYFEDLTITRILFGKAYTFWFRWPKWDFAMVPVGCGGWGAKCCLTFVSFSTLVIEPLCHQPKEKKKSTSRLLYYQIASRNN